MSGGLGFDFGLSKKKGAVAPQGEAQYTPPDSLKYAQPVNTPSPEDWEDVRQYYPEHAGVTEVPVSIERPVMVWNLPAKHSIVRSFHVPAVAAGVVPTELIPADPRIKSAWIVSDSNNPGAIYLGTKEQVTLVASGAGSDAYFYNGSTPLGPWQGFDQPLYAVAQTGSSVNIVNIRLEFWAD
jgi:hypothetical protein